MATLSVIKASRHGSGELWAIKQSPSTPASLSPTASRVTLVDTDLDLARSQNSDHDHGKVKNITSCTSKSTWVDQLLGVFCFNVPKEMHNDGMEFGGATTSEIDPLTWPSPWILPVYVYPQAQVKGGSSVPKVAKCTIDTGNLQGNIVSREFIESVLGYSAEDFHNLTETEIRGGTGITGDLHVPQAAIYLTWYHRNSTRVFHNMRFLVSSYQGCDLIIGARSIQKDKILTIPCLVIHNPPDKSSNGAELKKLIAKIKNHIRTTLTDDIKANQDDNKKKEVEELKDQKKDLEEIHKGYKEIWTVLFGKEVIEPETKKKDPEQLCKAMLLHPISDELTKVLKLQEVRDRFQIELDRTPSVPASAGKGSTTKASAS